MTSSKEYVKQLQDIQDNILDQEDPGKIEQLLKEFDKTAKKFQKQDKKEYSRSKKR